MPPGTYKFALQPGTYDLDELKTMLDLVQRVDKSQGNIYVRFTDTHQNMKFISHSGELKVKADGYDTDIIPIYITMVKGGHLLDRSRDTNRSGGWYRFPLNEPEVCKLINCDFDVDAIENGGEIDPQHNYLVFEDYLRVKIWAENAG